MLEMVMAIGGADWGRNVAFNRRTVDIVHDPT